MAKQYDVLIIGAGPAGLTSALYAIRSGLKTAVVSKDIGGTMNLILKIENWPGFSGTGKNLIKQFEDHVKKYDVEFILEEVKDISKKGKDFVVKTKKQTIQGKTIIIATGTERKKLNIKGEKELLGRGVSYCATCDAFFFKNKEVAVIGGSDCASTSALALSKIVKKVYIVYRKGELRCEEITKKELKGKKNVEIVYNAVTTEIKGKNKVEALVYEKEGKKKELKVEGVFIEIGSKALTELVEKFGLSLDPEKNVVVDQDMNTNIPGVFAAGDVTNQRLKQVVVASGQGAIAAKSAAEFLKK